MEGINSYFSIIILNTSKLNSSINTYRLVEWIKLKTQQMLTTWNSLHNEDHTDTENERMENGISSKWVWTKITGRGRIKVVTIIQGSFHQKRSTVINQYVPNIVTSSYRKQTLLGLKWETSSSVAMEIWILHSYRWTDHPGAASNSELKYTADEWT